MIQRASFPPAVLCVFLGLWSGSPPANGEDGKPAIRLLDIPPELSLPAPEGKNVILTAVVEKAKSVWLATAKDSRARFLLTAVGDGKYQANLADPQVAAMAEAAGAKGELFVFAETEGGETAQSVGVRYALVEDKDAPVKVYVRIEGKRKKVPMRGLSEVLDLLDGEARGDRLETWELQQVLYATRDETEPRAWYAPQEVDAIEVKCASAKVLEAEAGDEEFQLKRGEAQDVQVLEVNDDVRRAWCESGAITIALPVQKRRIPVTLGAIPDALELEQAGAGTRLVVYQRARSELPGSKGYLRLHIDDVTGGQTLLTLSAADGRVLIRDISMSQGDEVRFELRTKRYKISMVQLVNRLIGEDHVRLALSELTGSEASDLERVEARIDRLIRAVAGSDAVFLRDGKEFDGKKAAEHLREKYDSVRPSIKTVEQFIDKVGGVSWIGAEEYQVRLPGGSEVGAKAWFKERLADIDASPEAK